MTDREKVIKHITGYINAADGLKNVQWVLAELDILKDALALLKAHEPVKPGPKEVIYDDVHRSAYCPSCDNRLAGLTYSGAVALETEETPNYCWMCGQAVKW